MGRYDEAETVLAAARSRQVEPALASVRLAEVYFTTGRTEEGLELCREVLRDTGTQGPANAPNLMAAGLAARYLELSHEANSFLAAATRVDSEYLDAYVAWGRLFLDKHNRAEATGIFEDAAEDRPRVFRRRWSALAEALAEKQPLPAEAVARKALAVNPALMEGRHFLAGLHLTDEAYDEAIGHLDQALEVNPESPGTHALLAAAYHGQGRQAEFEAARQRVLNINPSYGRLYEILAGHLTRRYRFRESVEMGRRAIETDPALWSAYAGLGISLTRVGEMAEARRMLEQAFDRDPFDTRTYNTLELLDSFEDFETRESGPFVLKIHRDEDAVYGKLALDLLEEAHRTVAPRYGFTPEWTRARRNAAGQRRFHGAHRRRAGVRAACWGSASARWWWRIRPGPGRRGRSTGGRRSGTSTSTSPICSRRATAFPAGWRKASLSTRRVSPGRNGTWTWKRSSWMRRYRANCSPSAN